MVPKRVAFRRQFNLSTMLRVYMYIGMYIKQLPRKRPEIPPLQNSCDRAGGWRVECHPLEHLQLFTRYHGCNEPRGEFNTLSKHPLSLQHPLKNTRTNDLIYNPRNNRALTRESHKYHYRFIAEK